MGGNMLGVGNCGPYTGEFNFYGDSESAKIVLDKYAQQVNWFRNGFPKIDQDNQSNFNILVSSKRCNMGSNMFEQFSDVNFESSRFWNRVWASFASNQAAL